MRDMDALIELSRFVESRWREDAADGRPLTSARQEYGRLMDQMLAGDVDALEVVKRLALPYVDHEDYRGEWRP